MSELVPIANPLPLPALVSAAGDRAEIRFLEFFAVSIRNAHTRRA
jgi:integrase/recombinase XerC